MRVTAQDAPFEFFFALLMAASPIIGAIWVEPKWAKWLVFGVGCVMVLGVVLAALRPIRRVS